VQRLFVPTRFSAAGSSHATRIHAGPNTDKFIPNRPGRIRETLHVLTLEGTFKTNKENDDGTHHSSALSRISSVLKTCGLETASRQRAAALDFQIVRINKAS
jgi:hypothetical protein